MAATSRRNRVAAVALLVLLGLARDPHAGASGWSVVATSNATGLAQALDPQPPASVTATCANPSTDRSITVSWSAVDHATSYVVYRSATSATDGFAAVATGLTATTWTDSALKKGTYWYAVATVVGSAAWTSPISAPSAGHTVGTLPRCV